MSEDIVRGFGRLHAPDVRDFQYPMRAVLRPMPLPATRYYQAGPGLPMDQGDTGTCVAHAWRGFLMAAPMMTKNVPAVWDMYRGFVGIDEFPENDSEATEMDNQKLQSGTSVRAGVQWLRSRGHVKSFVWTRSADEGATWILGNKGTLVAGFNWYWDMSTPDKKGFVHIGGGIAGGHSFLIIGYNRLLKAFRCMQSWGTNWGQGGRFWLLHNDLQRLVQEDGELCAATEQYVAPVTP